MSFILFMFSSKLKLHSWHPQGLHIHSVVGILDLQPHACQPWPPHLQPCPTARSGHGAWDGSWHPQHHDPLRLRGETVLVYISKTRQAVTTDISGPLWFPCLLLLRLWGNAWGQWRYQLSTHLSSTLKKTLLHFFKVCIAWSLPVSPHVSWIGKRTRQSSWQGSFQNNNTSETNVVL